jgi:hypothetical protein
MQKRFQLLLEIAPAARMVGFLINPTSRQKDFDLVKRRRRRVFWASLW